MFKNKGYSNLIAAVLIGLGLLCSTKGQAWAAGDQTWPWEGDPSTQWEMLHGKWESIDASQVQPGVEVRGQLIFNLKSCEDMKHPDVARGEYQLTSMCSFYDGTYLQTSVQTHVRVDGNNVRTMEPVQSSTQQGSKYCTASIPTQIFQFQINKNILIMYTNSGKYYFQRR